MFSKEEMQAFGSLLLLSIAICVTCPPLKPIGVLVVILTLAAATLWLLLKLTLMLALAVLNAIAEFVAEFVTELADLVMVAAQGLAGLGQSIYQFISSLRAQDADLADSLIFTTTAVLVADDVPPLVEAQVVEHESYLDNVRLFCGVVSSLTPSAPPNLFPNYNGYPAA